MRKFAILVTTTALTLGITTSIGHAQSPIDGQSERVAIEVQTEKKVEKSDFIKKLKTLFPKQFDFLPDSEFKLSNAHHYPEDNRIRYDLSFQKTVKGKDVFGNVTFVGDNLDIESYYYNPITTSEVLFPAKVSKDEAQKIATNFLNKLTNGKKYQLDTNEYIYYSNQLLTEPIRYDFSFVQKQNDIPIADQRVYVTVLGDGTITSFYQFTQNSNKATFDDAKLAKSNQAVLDTVKKNLNVQLKYQIQYDYNTGEPSVALVYLPSIQFGINAITGEWQNANGFTKDTPKVGKVEALSSKPFAPKYNSVTVEQAKKIAEELLKIDSDDVKLNITSVHEYDNQFGQPFLSIQFSYDWEFGGYGSSIDMNQLTGEIISYSDIKGEVLRELGKSKEKKVLKESELQAKAIEHLKQLVPSYLHNYAKPISEPYFEKARGIYHFTFPRVVNGVVVEGSQINISVYTDGTLSSLYVNHQEFEEWPSVKNVISNEEARRLFNEAISINLQYVKIDSFKENHYNLVYTLNYNQNQFSYLDATTGKWVSLYGQTELPKVTHHTAEEELNYLIQNRILEIKDYKTFNADDSISNGDALRILVKSLSYLYEYELLDTEISTQTFKNIDKKHQLYSVVEQAVRIGILNPDEEFKPDTKLTREQLAVWYVRALGLELAGKNYDIYKLNLNDGYLIETKNVGYIALANALKLLPVENNQFNPKHEVTYANIASSIFPLAHIIHENRR
ncbi:S-layer homology domain-containing protein [Ureibacillus sp. MALMAid1270]|uniref:S-layer homology domain-containing protein n=1 Tax=Ureibacillus sp. MALMAid1270 TaxID=3411629 RepID=UPI003BA7946D